MLVADRRAVAEASGHKRLTECSDFCGLDKIFPTVRPGRCHVDRTLLRLLFSAPTTRIWQISALSLSTKLWSRSNVAILGTQGVQSFPYLGARHRSTPSLDITRSNVGIGHGFELRSGLRELKR